MSQEKLYINPYKDLLWMNKNIKDQMRQRRKFCKKAKCTQSPPVKVFTQYHEQFPELLSAFI